MKNDMKVAHHIKKIQFKNVLFVKFQKSAQCRFINNINSMGKLLSVLFVALFLVSCGKTQTTPKGEAQDAKFAEPKVIRDTIYATKPATGKDDGTHISKLEQTYCKLKEKDTPKNQKAFFDAFPFTWDEFYEQICKGDSLSDKGKNEKYDIVEAFGDLDAINDTMVCVKLLNLSLGARYDADESDALQETVYSKMNGWVGKGDDNKISPKAAVRIPKIMFWLLSNVVKGDQLRFWGFYWSSMYHDCDGGPHIDHSRDKEVEKMAKLMAGKYPQLERAMRTAYEYFSNGVYFWSDTEYKYGWFSVEHKYKYQ